MALKKSVIHGARELDRVLVQLPRQISETVLVGALTFGARPLVREAAARAPVRAGGPKKISKRSTKARLPGFLRASIAARRDRAGEGASVTVRVGPLRRAFYGMFQEFGTSHQSARPWLRPAWEATKAAVLNSIGTSLGRRIEKAAARLAGPFATSGLARRRRR